MAALSDSAPGKPSVIDRPLGREIAAPRPRRRWPALGTVLGSVLVLALFGGSAAIALRDRPWRMPAGSETAVTVAPVAVGETAEAAPRPETTRTTTSGGSAVIRVNPQSGPSGGGIVVRDPSAVGQDLRTAHMPDRTLVEDSELGPLPKRAADGRRPFDVYARPWSGARGARVAIVIGGLAVSQTGTQAAIASLPAEVTLAFASGGNSIDRWMQEARRKGHEILMQVPLEPFDYPGVNPGRNTLTVDAAPQDNIERLHQSLTRTTNYTGIMNYMGGRFVADRGAMSVLMDELAKRGLMYVDDSSSARSLAEELSKSYKGPYAAADTAIDQERDRGAILAKLDEAERVARAKGSAIAIGSAFDVTVDAVATWVGEAKKRGIEIVAVSALANDPEKN
ncbi:MAG: divergent polysaccharide deacetylase family protein [Rhizobiaceae bacterium]|nr:divergent polysaccharide deacetylase family protein [Rhizobiaceae bacterium]